MAPSYCSSDNDTADRTKLSKQAADSSWPIWASSGLSGLSECGPLEAAHHYQSSSIWSHKVGAGRKRTFPSARHDNKSGFHVCSGSKFGTKTFLQANDLITCYRVTSTASFHAEAFINTKFCELAAFHGKELVVAVTLTNKSLLTIT
jgi:hypothetical protein